VAAVPAPIQLWREKEKPSEAAAGGKNVGLNKKKRRDKTRPDQEQSRE